jgi:hypothetical protein
MGTDLYGFLFVSALFAVFVLLVCGPVALLVWGVRRWYAARRLAELPWRQRRVLLGLAMLWSAAFFALLTVFLVGLHESLYADSMESITIHNLRRGRDYWLCEGCQYPPDLEKYIGNSSGSRANYAHTNAYNIGGQTYHGLFATRAGQWDTNTYVVTTTDEILVLLGSGQARLLRRQGEW